MTPSLFIIDYLTLLSASLQCIERTADDIKAAFLTVAVNGKYLLWQEKPVEQP